MHQIGDRPKSSYHSSVTPDTSPTKQSSLVTSPRSEWATPSSDISSGRPPSAIGSGVGARTLSFQSLQGADCTAEGGAVEFVREKRSPSRRDWASKSPAEEADLVKQGTRDEEDHEEEDDTDSVCSVKTEDIFSRALADLDLLGTGTSIGAVSGLGLALDFDSKLRSLDHPDVDEKKASDFGSNRNNFRFDSQPQSESATSESTPEARGTFPLPNTTIPAGLVGSEGTSPPTQAQSSSTRRPSRADELGRQLQDLEAEKVQATPKAQQSPFYRRVSLAGSREALLADAAPPPTIPLPQTPVGSGFTGFRRNSAASSGSVGRSQLERRKSEDHRRPSLPVKLPLALKTANITRESTDTVSPTFSASSQTFNFSPPRPPKSDRRASQQSSPTTTPPTSSDTQRAIDQLDFGLPLESPTGPKAVTTSEAFNPVPRLILKDSALSDSIETRLIQQPDILSPTSTSSVSSCSASPDRRSSNASGAFSSIFNSSAEDLIGEDFSPISSAVASPVDSGFFSSFVASNHPIGKQVTSPIIVQGDASIEEDSIWRPTFVATQEEDEGEEGSPAHSSTPTPKMNSIIPNGHSPPAGRPHTTSDPSKTALGLVDHSGEPVASNAAVDEQPNTIAVLKQKAAGQMAQILPHGTEMQGGHQEIEEDDWEEEEEESEEEEDESEAEYIEETQEYSHHPVYHDASGGFVGYDDHEGADGGSNLLGGAARTTPNIRLSLSGAFSSQASLPLHLNQLEKSREESAHRRDRSHFSIPDVTVTVPEEDGDSVKFEHKVPAAKRRSYILHEGPNAASSSMANGKAKQSAKKRGLFGSSGLMSTQSNSKTSLATNSSNGDESDDAAYVDGRDSVSMDRRASSDASAAAVTITTGTAVAVKNKMVNGAASSTNKPKPLLTFDSDKNLAAHGADSDVTQVVDDVDERTPSPTNTSSSAASTDAATLPKKSRKSGFRLFSRGKDKEKQKAEPKSAAALVAAQREVQEQGMSASTSESSNLSEQSMDSIQTSNQSSKAPPALITKRTDASFEAPTRSPTIATDASASPTAASFSSANSVGSSSSAHSKAHKKELKAKLKAEQAMVKELEKIDKMVRAHDAKASKAAEKKQVEEDKARKKEEKKASKEAAKKSKDDAKQTPKQKTAALPAESSSPSTQPESADSAAKPIKRGFSVFRARKPQAGGKNTLARRPSTAKRNQEAKDSGDSTPRALLETAAPQIELGGESSSRFSFHADQFRAVTPTPAEMAEDVVAPLSPPRGGEKVQRQSSVKRALQKMDAEEERLRKQRVGVRRNGSIRSKNESKGQADILHDGRVAKQLLEKEETDDSAWVEDEPASTAEDHEIESMGPSITITAPDSPPRPREVREGAVSTIKPKVVEVPSPTAKAKAPTAPPRHSTGEVLYSSSDASVGAPQQKGSPGPVRLPTRRRNHDQQKLDRFIFPPRS